MKRKYQNKTPRILFFIFKLLLGTVVMIAIGIFCVNLYQFKQLPTCKNCNVILISLDTLSANHLPCYGYKRNTAPNLCQFGKENIMLTNMYANASYTLPSHVSIFTGLYPNQHKVNIPNTDRLSRDIPFLPEILQQHGYKTYFYMPKNAPHLPINLVYNRGIDEIVDADHPKNDWVNGLMKMKENNSKGQKTFLFLHTYWVHSLYIPENKDRVIFAKNLDDYPLPKTTEEMTKCTRQFLNYLKKALKDDLEGNAFGSDREKLMIYEKMNDELRRLIVSGKEAQLCNQQEYKEYLYPYFSSFYVSSIKYFGKNTMNQLIDLYDSKIYELDEYLKGVLEFVTESELNKNTVIIVTADHGEEFMEHGMYYHANNLYDTSLKVPFMMFIPGQHNRVIDTLSQSVDIFPTIIRILDIPKVVRTSGKDLFENTLTFFKQKYVFAFHINPGETQYIVRDLRWKLHYRILKSQIIPVELYDIESDSTEKNNVIFSNPQVVKRLIKNIPR